MRLRLPLPGWRKSERTAFRAVLLVLATTVPAQAATATGAVLVRPLPSGSIVIDVGTLRAVAPNSAPIDPRAVVSKSGPTFVPVAGTIYVGTFRAVAPNSAPIDPRSVLPPRQ